MEHVMDSRLLWGTVEMLTLDVVAEGPTYGYLIAHAVMSRSDGYFELKEGSLYPAFHRMERQKLLKATWSESDEGRRRKYYKLTPAGQKSLEKKRDEWSKFSKSVNSVLGAGA
jgi:PadR family transcriptional regulator